MWKSSWTASRSAWSTKGKPSPLPGLTPGEHTVKGVKMGYEPDGPRQETVYPGQESTVSIKILIARRRKKAAVDLLDKGIEVLPEGLRAELQEGRASCSRRRSSSTPLTARRPSTWASLTTPCSTRTKAEQYFKKAIEIDPDYLEAHANYAGMLLDIGDVDEAIRQFNTVLQREPNHAEALTMLAQAYRFKALYPQSIESARKAIQLTPKNAEPHLWLADSLRLSGKYADAEPEYDQYLQAQRFRQQAGRPVELLCAGFAVRNRQEEARRRSRTSGRTCAAWPTSASAIASATCRTSIQPSRYCQKSLTYDSRDPYAHYALGLSYMHKAVQAGSIAELDPALPHFQQMMAINPDLDEADYARKNIASIQKALGVR